MPGYGGDFNLSAKGPNGLNDRLIVNKLLLLSVHMPFYAYAQDRDRQHDRPTLFCR
jgi:hypothetical protein